MATRGLRSFENLRDLSTDSHLCTYVNSSGYERDSSCSKLHTVRGSVFLRSTIPAVTPQHFSSMASAFSSGRSSAAAAA